MAFGKDQSAVGNMNLRQQMRQGTKRAPRSSGGGGGGALYRDQYRPPSDGTSDIIRIFAGSYPTPQVDFDNKDYFYNEDGSVVTVNMPYFKYIDYYFHPRSRQIVGSEGPLGGFKGKGNACLAADWYWYEWRERNRTGNKKSPNTLRRTDKCAVSVLVHAPFYHVPQEDKDGTVRMNENTKTPYMEWRKGSLRENDALAAGGYEKKFGHVMHWSLGYGHWETLLSYANGLSSNCRTCHAQNTIQEMALVCRHCGEAIVEFDSTTLSEPELIKIREEPVHCRQCNQSSYLNNIIQCTNCNQGEEATLFDFDLEVKQVKSSEEGKGSALQVLKALGPRPLDDRFKDDLRKGLDLAKIFTPFSEDAQLKILGRVPEEPTEGQGQEQQQSGRQPVTGGSRSYV